MINRVLQVTVLDMAMVFQDNEDELVDMVESMLVFVCRGLQQREQFRPLIEVVQKTHPSAKPLQLVSARRGKAMRMPITEARRILREKLGVTWQDGRILTYAVSSLRFFPFFCQSHPCVLHPDQLPKR
jgi:aspartyl-tRNA synthetase